MNDKKHINKILVVSLSNIGDVILTFPVLDVLKRDFPDVRLDLFVGPKGEPLVKDNPAFGKIYVYHKNEPVLSILKGIKELADEQYDLVVDLRNSAIPFLIFAKKKTPPMLVRPQGLHMRQQHLNRLGLVHRFNTEASEKVSLRLAPVAVPDGKYVVIAPGSRAENKRWPEQGFAKVAEHLAQQYGLKIVLVGDDNDIAIAGKISKLMSVSILDLTGKLSLPQVGYLMSRSSLAVVNDSAPLHLASYLNIPVAAFFGPTDPGKYGPWSEKKIVIQNTSHCPACVGDRSRLHDCIQAPSFDDAIKVLEPWFREILGGK
ncbi:MAG: glycosyltransferase family 9 protein [Candidatus Omnitrophica bacterium]|nr:glycosyltransferase family 9 protein [Candidatus Omnitrophota bacterium]